MNREAAHLFHSESQAANPANTQRLKDSRIIICSGSMEPTRIRELTGCDDDCILLPSHNSHMIKWSPENAFWSSLAADLMNNPAFFYTGAPGNPHGYREGFDYGRNQDGTVANLELRPSAALAKRYAEVLAPRLQKFGNRLYLDDGFAESPDYHTAHSLPYWLNDTENFEAWWNGYVEMLVRLLVEKYGIEVWANCAGSPPEFADQVCCEGPSTEHILMLDLAMSSERGSDNIYFFGDPPLDVPGVCVAGYHLEN